MNDILKNKLSDYPSRWCANVISKKKIKIKSIKSSTNEKLLEKKLEQRGIRNIWKYIPYDEFGLVIEICVCINQSSTLAIRIINFNHWIEGERERARVKELILFLKQWTKILIMWCNHQSSSSYVYRNNNIILG